MRLTRFEIAVLAMASITLFGKVTGGLGAWLYLLFPAIFIFACVDLFRSQRRFRKRHDEYGRQGAARMLAFLNDPSRVASDQYSPTGLYEVRSLVRCDERAWRDFDNATFTYEVWLARDPDGFFVYRDDGSTQTIGHAPGWLAADMKRWTAKHGKSAPLASASFRESSVVTRSDKAPA